MTDELFDLSGRVAVITGGLGQMGRVYTDGLVARGMRVAVFDVAAEAGGEGDVRHYCVDVTDRGSVDAATADVVAEWGAPHLLVNNAALDSPPDAPPEEVGPFETYPEASFDEVMDVNVKGVVLCCQVVGAAMAEAGRGSIVNVSSVYGLLSPPQDLYEFRRQAGETFFKPVAYSVSKSALLEPHPLPRDVLGEGGSAREHADARRDLQRAAAGVPRRVWRARPPGEDGRSGRGAWRRRLSRLGCLVVRHGRQPRRRRRLVRLVSRPPA